MLYVAVALELVPALLDLHRGDARRHLHQLGLRRDHLVLLHRGLERRTPPPAGTTSPTRSPTAGSAQAMIMTVAIWGGGTTDDVADADPHRRRRHRPLPAGELPRLVPGRRPRPRGVPPADPGRRADRRRRAALRPALPDRPADLPGVPGLGGARGRGQLRRSGCWSPASAFWLLDQTGAADALARCSRCSSAGSSCRWCCSRSRLRERRRWRCRGRRSSRCPIDIWLGQRDGLRRARRPRRSRRAGAPCCCSAARRCSGSPTARWWSRVAEPGRAAAWDVRAFAILAGDVDPGRLDATARRSWC